MSLEKILREKYNDREYERTFGGDFSEAVRSMDKIIAVLSRKEKKDKE